jgi:hypothetical protein
MGLLLADTTLITHPIATADAHFEWANRGCPEGGRGFRSFLQSVTFMSLTYWMFGTIGKPILSSLAVKIVHELIRS